MSENIKQDRLKEITESIERGIRELFASDKYQQYLQTMSRFHRYSVNNTVLVTCRSRTQRWLRDSENGAISFSVMS